MGKENITGIFPYFLSNRDALVRESFKNFSQWEGKVHDKCGEPFRAVRADANFDISEANDPDHPVFLNVSGMICMECKCVEGDSPEKRKPRVVMFENDLTSIKKEFETQTGSSASILSVPLFDCIKELAEIELEKIRRIK